MIHCRLIYPYFDNPGMLERQVENWSRFEGELRNHVKIILVDDCSKKHPAWPIAEKCKAPLSLYVVKERLPWNMHQCRNIGAKVCGQDDMWMFMSDIDIMLTPEMAYTMMTKDPDPYYHYTMERTFAPEFDERKTHVNTFLVKRGAFWQVNGYDLDLTGGYGGGYGGDNQFVRQLSAICPRRHFSDVVLVGFGRRSRDGKPVLPDADTTSLDRAEWHEKYKAALERKKKSGDMRSVSPIRAHYERLI